MSVMEKTTNPGNSQGQSITTSDRLCDNPHLQDGQYVSASAFARAAEAQPGLLQSSHTEAIGDELVCAAEACGACALQDLRFRRTPGCHGLQEEAPELPPLPHQRVVA